MRVLQLIDSLEAGGAERMAVNLANTLSTELDMSYLCATRKEGLLKSTLYPEVGYLFLEKKYKFDLQAIKRLFFFIDQHQITIIHAHSTSFFMATFMKWLRPSLKIVWHDHYGNCNFLESRPLKVLKLCSSYFSIILSVNSTLTTWAQNKLNCKSVRYLPNFVKVDSENKITILNGVEGKRILCLANLREQKDHPTLIKAFESIHKEFPDWSLHCVGQDFEDAYSAKIYKLVKELQLENQVYFYGSCADTGNIIEQSSIGVLSSSSEGMPLTLLEYAYMKLPVVVTNVGDCHTIFSDKTTPYLIAPGQPLEFAQALKSLIKDETLRISLGESLYQHTANNFSENSVREKLIRIYSQL